MIFLFFGGRLCSMVEFSTSYPQVFHRLDLTWGGW
nr:MAG TPA: hypothetical protein [Caudoviricetes sp.]